MGHEARREGPCHLRPSHAPEVGLCSTTGTLSFNDELIGMDQEIGDYVIVHELLHFSVPNHGKLWKALMRAHLGDWEELERRLNNSVNRREK
jgi:predicted metal-dependent hydrolase